MHQVQRGLVWTFVTIACAGLLVDGITHLDLARSYSLVRSSLVNEADLFRIEGVAAILVGFALVIRPSRMTALLAVVVGLAGAAALLLYTYFDPGAIGPIPDMYEPVWYREKSLSFVGEVVAALAGVALLVALHFKTPLPRRSDPDAAMPGAGGGRRPRG